MVGYYTDTRQAVGVPNIRITHLVPAHPQLSTVDALVPPHQYTDVNKEPNQRYPGYRDSVRSFRSNRSSSPDKPTSILGDVPAIQELTGQVQPDSGHEFDSVKHEMVPWDRFRPRRVDFNSGGTPQSYIGPLFHGGQTNATALGFKGDFDLGEGTSLWGPTIPDLTPDWGTKAIAKVAPTKSNASIATALIELRDGLPKMPGKALKGARGFKDLTKVGPEEFLNYVFGLVPTLSDIRSIASAIVNQKKILDQFQRDNDKVVRRRYGFPLQSDVQNWTTPPGTAYPADRVIPVPFPTWAKLGSNVQLTEMFVEAPASRTLSTQSKIWFSGAFRYHLASTDSQWGRIERTSQLMAHLLGARLDAEALWAAMPWSWLVDWFSDVGDIISNATHAVLDGQLLQYGYVMCETTQYSTITSHNLTSRTGQRFGDITTAFITRRKQRVKATPYGFGLNPDSFSAQQWAILGSLGMTRAPKTLF